MTVLPGHSVHKVWRGHNHEPNLGTDEQKLAYIEFLNSDIEDDDYKKGSQIQALTLMTNHVHEMHHIEVSKLFSDQMRRHHARYGSYFNRENNRCGKVAQDRPHTTLLETSQNEMEVVFYIHANPIRANMVRDARNYPWSTHVLYAFGKRAPWMRHIKLPKWYLKLGATPELRQRAYRRMFNRYLAVKGRFKQRLLKSRFLCSPTLCDKKQEANKKMREEHSPP